MMKKIIKQVLLATCVIGAPTSVFALPFNPDPQSLQNYMNAVRWSDGSTAKFQNLGGCSFSHADGVSNYFDAGVCTTGFVTISSPMGTRICTVTNAGYGRFIQNKDSGGVSYKTGECRYK